MKTLQERFIEFSTSDAGKSLTELEGRCLLAFYAAADPATGVVRLSVGRAAKKLEISSGKTATVVDYLTGKGILKTITPSDDKKGIPAVRQLVFKDIQNETLQRG